MKLLCCLNCGDVIKLISRQERVCDCGQSAGQYVGRLEATYRGPALLLGIDNPSLDSALEDQAIKGDDGLEGTRRGLMGRRIEAFVIPESASSIKRTDARPALAKLIEDQKRTEVAQILSQLMELEAARDRPSGAGNEAEARPRKPRSPRSPKPRK